jgi:hypothetical protein
VEKGAPTDGKGVPFEKKGAPMLQRTTRCSNRQAESTGEKNARESDEKSRPVVRGQQVM